jgi:hypothetical protein
MIISSEEISVVVQGPLDKELTFECLSSIRKWLPGSEIILSSWQNSDTNELIYDKLVKSIDPKAFPYKSESKSKKNNVNRQIVSTIAGLREASRPYALKIRTDFILKGNSFLNYFYRFPKYEKDFRIFGHKIINLCYFSRNPRSQPFSYPFHPSDIALFGMTDDLYNLFDIPLMQKSDSTYLRLNESGSKFNRFVPEQHIFINCLWKNGHNIDFLHQRDDCNEMIELTERYFASNFIFINFDEFNLVPPKALINVYYNNFQSCITHVEWQKLYQKYNDSNYAVDLFDIERKRLRERYLLIKFGKYISNLLALFFIVKPLRRKIRSNIRIFIYKLMFRE